MYHNVLYGAQAGAFPNFGNFKSKQYNLTDKGDSDTNIENKGDSSRDGQSDDSHPGSLDPAVTRRQMEDVCDKRGSTEEGSGVVVEVVTGVGALEHCPGADCEEDAEDQPLEVAHYC